MAAGHRPQLLKQRLVYQGRKFNFEVVTCAYPTSQNVTGNAFVTGGALAVRVPHLMVSSSVRQYRFAIQSRILEFPRKQLNHTKIQPETIQREIEEEIGYRMATNGKSGANFPLPGLFGIHACAPRQDLES
jgi:ADP-ribose pyrophosphatase